MTFTEWFEMNCGKISTDRSLFGLDNEIRKIAYPL